MKKSFNWRKLFPLPTWVSLIIFAACCSCLVFIFLRSLEETALAYIVYVLSAYSLTALCLTFPRGIQSVKGWLRRHPKTANILVGREFRFNADLYFEQFVNFAYGIFKVLSGLVTVSSWLVTDGIYNLTQASIQLFQIVRRRNPGSISDQWRSYRLCGVLLLFMHLTLTGIAYQMINLNRIKEQGEIMLISTAAFVFYSLISGFIRLVRDRKHSRPIDSSVRMLKFSQASFALFSLQVGLLHGFGSGLGWEKALNMATGGVVCLLVAATGIYMILRANRELRKIQENENGNR